jgi:hypothetical protein
MTKDEALLTAIKAMKSFQDGTNGLYESEFEEEIRACEEALAQPEQEPVAVHQFRSPHCSDWYDGVPDHHDGHGPYEVRTLYTHTPVPTAQQEKEPVGFTIQAEIDYAKNNPKEYAGFWANKDDDGEDWIALYTTPPQRKPPQFPTVLRKMWSGSEVQDWINENWSKT